MNVIREDELFGKEYACKILAKKPCNRNFALLCTYRNEIDIHSKLAHHDNVVRLYDTFQDDKFIYMIISICSQGSLHDVQYRQDRPFNAFEAKGYLREIMRGLQFIHQNHIIHCDIKPGNIFIDWRFSARIGDFGLAKQIESWNNDTNGELYAPNRGTLNFIAPESITRKVVSYKTDVWAVGVTAYFMRLGHKPFEGIDESDTRQLITDIDY